jgi:hypothetical protein
MLTPSRLWKQLTTAERLKLARAFWLADEAAQDQVHAVLTISQQKKFRPKTVAALDHDRKARHLASIAVVPDQVASRALVAYHLAEQRPMMSAFLDAVGVPHDNGLIRDEAVKPESAKLKAAAADLAGQFPAADVALYFSTLVMQDPEAWGLLESLLEQPAEAPPR